MESLNPIDGLDEPLRPLNMVEESDATDLEIGRSKLGTPSQGTP
jgi:hypothetical protein